jgi:peroxiredoxin
MTVAPAAAVETAQVEAVPAAAATPAAPVEAVGMAAMDHSAPAAHAAMASAPAAKPAPAPVAAPPEPETGGYVLPAAAVTNHDLPHAKIANFKLADQTGKMWELYKLTGAKAIVLTMHTKGCPIGQQLVPDFKELQEKYGPKGVQFLMLNSNSYDTPKMIAEEVASFKSVIPVLKDTPDQSVGEPLGVERATESLVIEPGTWKILYQGPINDRVTYGRARAKADQQYVGNVLDAMLTGHKVTPAYIAPEGCILVFDNRGKG